MAASRTLVVALAVAALAATPAEAQAPRSPHFLAKQCNEDAIAVRVDPRRLQEHVGSAFSLVLEEGRARVLIVVHDCAQYWMDGEDVGPTQETQIWVLIHGLEDVRPVIGAERTLPTRTWFSLFSGSNNPRVREAKGAAGTAQASIEGVVLDRPGPRRGGRLSLSRNLEYSWTAVSATPAVRLLGMNFDVFVRDAAGNVALNRIQALLRIVAANSPGTLNVAGDTDLLPLIPPGTYEASVQTFFPMWSRATLGLPPSPGATVPTDDEPAAPPAQRRAYTVLLPCRSNARIS